MFLGLGRANGRRHSIEDRVCLCDGDCVELYVCRNGFELASNKAPKSKLTDLSQLQLHCSAFHHYGRYFKKKASSRTCALQLVLTTLVGFSERF